MSDEPTERLELRITPDLRDAIDRQAKEEGRHITSMARLLIERGLVQTTQSRQRHQKATVRARLSAIPVSERRGLDKPRKRPR